MTIGVTVKYSCDEAGCHAYRFSSYVVDMVRDAGKTIDTRGELEGWGWKIDVQKGLLCAEHSGVIVGENKGKLEENEEIGGGGRVGWEG